MRTKLSWGESDKGNVIGLVEALLALAEGELELDDSELKTAVQVKWESACKLRVTGKIKQTRGKREQTVEVGTTKKDLVKLVKKFGKSLEFPKRQKGLGRSKEEREADVVQNVIDYLKALKVLEEDAKNTRKNQGFWQFILTLESEFATREDNLRSIKQKWNEQTQQNSPSQITSKSATEEGINWHDVCGKVLAQQREKQNFRRSITGRHLGHEAKNVYVKLGLVKPKKQPRRGDEFQPSADRGMLQYQLTEKEIEQEYQYDEFLEQVIEGREKNLTIVGEPGAGKSTWLEQIALYVDNSNKGFPICISLASLGGKTLEEYLFQIWLKNALLISQCDVSITSAHKKLEDLFKSGKVWLLLDGVDEMRADESPLQAIATQLEGWGDLARVVLTCRSNVWDANPNALLNFETYRTLHFDDEQVGDFIQQWFTQECKPKLGEELETKLDEARNDRIRDLIKNPLRLAMLCGIWYSRRGDLPKTKATLYQQYIEEYFYRWKPHPQLTDDLDKQEELHAAFSKLALEAIDKKLPLRKKFVHKAMGKSLFQLARDVGWLNWVYKDAETGEDVYAFFHLTFQEYFAACAIDDWRYFLNHDNENPNPLLNPNPSLEYDDGKPRYRIFEPRWKEVFLLWMGCDNTEVPNEFKEQFIQALIEFNEGIEPFFYKHRAFFLATAAMAEFANFHWGDAIVAHLVKGGFGHFSTKEQKWVTFFEPIAEAARLALQETEPIKAVDALVNFIQNCNDKNIQWKAIYNLGQVGRGNPMAVKALVKFIQQSQDENTRHSVAQILGRIDRGNLIAADTLVKLIGNSQETSTRQWAADSLAEIGITNQITVDALVELTGKLHDEDVRRLAAYCLGKIDKGNPTAISTLKDISLKSQDEDMCWRTVECIGKIGKGNPKAVAALVEVIRKYQDGFVRWLAAKSLWKIDKGSRIAITAFIDLIRNSQDKITQSEAAETLGEIAKGNPIAVATLVELIENYQDEFTRSQAAYCLGQVDNGNPTAIAALVDLIMNSEDENICRIAAVHLGQVAKGNSTAIAALEDLSLNSEDCYIRNKAAHDLEQIDKGNPTAIVALMDLIQNPQPEWPIWLPILSLEIIGAANSTAIIPNPG